MLHKKLLTVLILIMLSVSALPHGITTADENSASAIEEHTGGNLTPHQDPETAELRYDGIAIIDHYSQLTETVLDKAPEQTEALRKKNPFANIPKSIEQPLLNFGNATVTISWLITDIEETLDALDLLARQFRFEELDEQWPHTQHGLTQAFDQLAIIENSAAITARNLGADQPGESSPLTNAYLNLRNRIESIRGLLELHQTLLDALSKASLQELRPTELTLRIEPTTAFVGDWIEYSGGLASEEAALPGREVTVLVNGIPYVSSITGPDGLYQGQMQMPAIYRPSIALQALYYPQFDDAGIYLASRSPSIEVQVLFYTAPLLLETEGRSYPGLISSFYGNFDYGDQPIPPNRTIQVFFDNRLVSQTSVQASFEIEIYNDPETVLGQHRISVTALGQARYAPVTAATTLDVIKAIPIIETSSPGIALMPFSLSLEGRVYSELGPVQGAVVEASLGGHNTQATTSRDGTFAVKLANSMNISLIGSRDITLKVNPANPWNATASTSWSLIIVNPILMGIVALMLVIVIVTFTRRKRIAPASPATAVSAPVAGTLNAIPGGESPVKATSRLGRRKDMKDPRQLTFELYRMLLRLIQDFTNIMIRPQMTLREFALQCAPSLGPAHRYLDQFTGIVERLLYSKHPPEPVDLEQGQELAKSMEESLKHDRT